MKKKAAKPQVSTINAVMDISITFKDETVNKSIVIKNPAGFMLKPFCNAEGLMTEVTKSIKIG